ncbi:MAG TPA: SNF2-related protein [Pyrinomonadaceae bacterium]|jgi:DnaJ-domain-containing protein 1
MSFIKTLSQKLGNTVSPIPEPIVFQLPLLKLKKDSVINIPIPADEAKTFQLPIPEIKQITTHSLKPAFKATGVFKLSNGLFQSPEISCNLFFSIPAIETKSFFVKSEIPKIQCFEFSFDSRVTEDLNKGFAPTQIRSNNLFNNEQTWVSDNLFNIEQPCLTDNLFKLLNKSKVSGDLVQEIFNRQEETIVSENLFKRLLPQNVNGKKYEKRANRQPEQGDLFSSKTKSKSDGFVKAYKRGKNQGSNASFTTQTLTFWDLLYPVLLPPLDVDFNSQFELFKPLFKFQPAGIEFLVTNESALLADEMGTGKTVMSAVALKLLFRLGRAKKALIVCPVSLLNTWQEHLLDWAGELELTVVRGAPDIRKLDWKYNAHVYLTTYDTVASDFLTKIKKQNDFKCPKCKNHVNLGSKITVEDDNMPYFSCPYCHSYLNDYLIENLPKKEPIVDPEILDSFDVVLIDEAQYIKNKSSDRSRAIRLLKPKYKWALTGTPIENRLDDLISIFSFVKPDLFKKNQYISPRQASELIKPYFLRRLKKDVMKDLPPKVKQEIWLELDNDQMKAYKSVEQLGIKEIEDLGGKVTKIHIFSLLSKLKQICNFAPNKDKSAKTEELLDLVEQIKDNKQKVLIFSQYDVEGVTKLEKLLQPFGVSLLKGGMSDAARKSAINSFKHDPDISVFLATIKTGGVGLTLTEASYVIHFDHWWNPALMWQADDRVHRSGQKSSQVNIYSFWMKGTVEERIHAILKEKGLLFDEVINGLSVEDIDEMFTIDDWLDVLGIKSNKRANNGDKSQNNTYREYQSQRQQAHSTEEQKDSRDTNQQQKEKEQQSKNTDSRQTNSNNYQHYKQNSVVSDEKVRQAFIILGVSSDAKKDEIVKAYRDLMKLYHPDKVGCSSQNASMRAEEKAKEINVALDTLKKHKYL